MSLIRVRKERKKAGVDVKRGRSIRLLVFLLILVGLAVWWLDTRF